MTAEQLILVQYIWAFNVHEIITSMLNSQRSKASQQANNYVQIKTKHSDIYI